MKRLALAFLTAFCLLGAAAEAKQPPLSLLSGSEFGIRPIDAGRGYYESPRGTLHIVNTRAHSTRMVALPDGCEASDVRGPLVLLGCGEPVSFELWNSFTREITALDLSQCESHSHTIGLGQIGRYWIEGSYDTGHYDWAEEGAGHEVYGVVYLNRASGECRIYQDGYNRDIDRADLPPPHYGVPDRCTRGKKFIVEHRSRGGEYVKLCKKHAPWRRSGCGDGTPGRNLLACLERDRLRVYLPASGRQLSWRTHGYGFPTVLGDRVFVNIDDNDAPEILIYTVDLSRLVRR